MTFVIERELQERDVLPHPGPLPLGEGASQPALGDDERVRSNEDWMPFSLSSGEWAGVRGSGVALAKRKFFWQSRAAP